MGSLGIQIPASKKFSSRLSVATVAVNQKGNENHPMQRSLKSAFPNYHSSAKCGTRV